MTAVTSLRVGVLAYPGCFASEVFAVPDLLTLAAHVVAGVSPRTLLRRFGAETGQSPLRYLQAARVRRAQHLLETTDRTVAGISSAVGYQDPATFAALFAAHTGQRPSSYRAAFRRTSAVGSGQ
jgi:transcriptional regulator GlxA family with amidase domain